MVPTLFIFRILTHGSSTETLGSSYHSQLDRRGARSPSLSWRDSIFTFLLVVTCGFSRFQKQNKLLILLIIDGYNSHSASNSFHWLSSGSLGLSLIQSLSPVVAMVNLMIPLHPYLALFHLYCSLLLPQLYPSMIVNLPWVGGV